MDPLRAMDVLTFALMVMVLLGASSCHKPSNTQLSTNNFLNPTLSSDKQSITAHQMAAERPSTTLASVDGSEVAYPGSQRFVLGWWMWTPGDTVDDSMQNSIVAGYVPDQPLPFSHKLHAGERQIACQFCHSGARRSASAVVPGLDTCMGCHQVVATDREPIKQLKDHWDRKDPIQWIKVHDLPDHVRFSHKPHVAANMSCESCHGDVKNMEKLGQWAPLQMGWCLTCHKERQAPISCQTCHY